MPVPEEVRRAERPKNSVVVDTGSNGPKRYAVRERKSVKYVPGGNPQPQNGKIIGYIVDHHFVPRQEMESAPTKAPKCLQYGAAALIHHVAGEVCRDLQQVFMPNDATSLMAAAAAKVTLPYYLSGRQLSLQYQRTFLKVFYPGARLSQEDQQELYLRIGRDKERRLAFQSLRAAAVPSDHLVVLCSLGGNQLLTDHSDSPWYFNDAEAEKQAGADARRKPDFFTVFAYDPVSLEPISFLSLPGSEPDCSAYSRFLEENPQLQSCIYTSDTNIDMPLFRQLSSYCPSLHYLMPWREASSEDSAEDKGLLETGYGTVLYSKSAAREHQFQYMFQGVREQMADPFFWFSTAFSAFRISSGRGRRRPANTLSLRSDLDLPPQTVYRIQSTQHLMKLVVKQFDLGPGFEAPEAKNTIMLAGEEFVNNIASILSAKVFQALLSAGLLEKFSYGDQLTELGSVLRVADAPIPPSREDGSWASAAEEDFEMLEKLGIMPAAPASAQESRRGRPRQQ